MKRLIKITSLIAFLSLAVSHHSFSFNSPESRMGVSTPTKGGKLNQLLRGGFGPNGVGAARLPFLNSPAGQSFRNALTNILETRNLSPNQIIHIRDQLNNTLPTLLKKNPDLLRSGLEKIVNDVIRHMSK